MSDKRGLAFRYRPPGFSERMQALYELPATMSKITSYVSPCAEPAEWHGGSFLEAHIFRFLDDGSVTRYRHVFPVGSEPQSGRSEDGVTDSEPRDIATHLDHDPGEIVAQDRAPRPKDAEYQTQRQPEPFDRKPEGTQFAISLRRLSRAHLNQYIVVSKSRTLDLSDRKHFGRSVT
jgi:hypothetical protein